MATDRYLLDYGLVQRFYIRNFISEIFDIRIIYIKESRELYIPGFSGVFGWQRRSDFGCLYYSVHVCAAQISV